MVGSHTDSVLPNGGNYDGVVGVLSAIEAVRSMIDDGFEHGTYYCCSRFYV